MITRDDVLNAYRLVLGRDTENDEVVDRHLAAAATVNDLRFRILGSPEFYKVNARELLRYFSGQVAQRTRNFIEFDASPEDLKKLFDHIKSVWTTLGEIEPHYSVSSTTNFKPENIEANLHKFEQSGKGEVDLLVSELKSHGFKGAGYSRCVELGSGVGRVTRHLAELADKVTGLDISAPHLKLAEDYFAREGVNNVSLMHLTDPLALNIPPCDLFYSRIVLQHNPPPVQIFLIRAFLKALRPGGVAVFQIPTYIEGYDFSVSEYLSGMDRLDNQELHALPKRAIFSASEAAGCEVYSAYRDNSLSAITSDSTRFVVVKG